MKPRKKAVAPFSGGTIIIEESKVYQKPVFISVPTPIRKPKPITVIVGMIEPVSKPKPITLIVKTLETVKKLPKKCSIKQRRTSK